jgi:signal peptidase I
MENTLLVGDFLFVNKLLYGAEIPLTGKKLPAVREPRRNEILVFDSVEEPGLKVVKRLIGVPGDTLAMENGTLIRNGQRVEEPYAVHANPSVLAEPDQREHMRAWQSLHLAGRSPEGYHPDLQNWGPIVVPADSFFMMGDNRDSSRDSRFLGEVGYVPFVNLIGRAEVLFFSVDGPALRFWDWYRTVRFDRLFRSIQ